MAQMTFETANDYVEALASNPSLAILPLQMVADMRGVTRPAIDRMVRIGHLEEIRIADTRYVRAASVHALTRKFDEQVAAVRHYLEGKARQRSIVFYEPVMAIVGLSPGVPADRTTIGGILGKVSELTWKLPKAERHLLSVIVHRKTAGKTRPGPGFVALADYLRDNEGLPDWQDEDALVERETGRVWRLYANKN